MRSSVLKNQEKPLDSVLIPYMAGISKKSKHIRNHYNIEQPSKQRILLGVCS
jgi:hypothetical protein